MVVKFLQKPAFGILLFSLLLGTTMAPQKIHPQQTQGEVTPQSLPNKTEKIFSLPELLAAYLANHREIHSLMIQLEQQKLSNQSTKINQGLQLNLSTGTFSIGSSLIKTEPSLTISMPQWQNSYLDLTVPLQFNSWDSTANTSSSAAGSSGATNKTLQGATVTIGTEILGSSGKSAKLNLLKAERTLLEAQRRVQSQALAVEQEFYTTIKDLYSSYASLLSAQDSVYTKELDLKTLQVQGYGTNSTRYRTAQLEVLSAQKTVDRHQRNLQKDLKLFAQKCGFTEDKDFFLDKFSSVTELMVATCILEALPLEPEERFTTIEAAQWSLSTTQMELEADSPVSLSAEAGYTYKNPSVTTGNSQSDTVNAALVMEALGGRLSTGVAIPITGEEKTPTAQVSLSWSPNDMRTQALERQRNQLNLELAQLKIQDAQENYEETLENTILTWEDFIWNRQVALEERDLYQELAEDTINLYNRGMTSQTEYQQALTNRTRAQIQCEIADLELMLHFISTKQLFVQEVDQ